MVSNQTAFEIFTNPKDLHITVYKEEDGWGFTIMRGSDHNYKRLLMAKPFFESKNASVDDIVEILSSIYKNCLKIVTDPTSGMGNLVNREQITAEEAGDAWLTPETIKSIKQALIEDGCVDTSKP